MPVLEARNLSKRYQMGTVTVSALSHVLLSVEKGEFIAIMGPSGSGKSTLLHLLGGLDAPTSGEIIIAGQLLNQLSDDKLTILRRRKIGFIFQFYNLLPTLSADENVGLPLWIDGKDLTKQRSKIDGLLAMVGLGERRDHRPSQLSGGQQQRVAVARAFANTPEIVLADEPTGNLDSKSGTAILDLLQKTCAELGATIVMVTHDPRAASYAGRLIFLKDGEIVHEQKNTASSHSVQNIMDVLAALEA